MICNLIKMLYESNIGEEKHKIQIYPFYFGDHFIITNDFNIAKEIYKMKTIYIEIPRRVCLAQ